MAVAALPLLAGMGPDAYRSASAFDASFNRAMPICAGVLVLGSVLAFFLVTGRPTAGCQHPERHTHCSLTTPPLEGERTGP